MLIHLSGSHKKGFSLVELMVVIAIIAILAAIALPNFIARRKDGFNSMAVSDAKNAYTAAQAYFNDYPSKVLGGAIQLFPYGFSLSSDEVSMTISGNNSTLQITSTHSKGSKTYTVNAQGNISF